VSATHGAPALEKLSDDLRSRMAPARGEITIHPARRASRAPGAAREAMPERALFRALPLCSAAGKFVLGLGPGGVASSRSSSNFSGKTDGLRAGAFAPRHRMAAGGKGCAASSVASAPAARKMWRFA